MPFVLGLGVIGGLAIGSWAVEHLFVEGTSDKERRGILIFSAVTIAGYAAANLLDVDRRWYSVDAWIEEADRAAGASAP